MSNFNEASTVKLAEQAGVHRATCWRWLTGAARPSKLAYARLAQLGVVLQLPPLKPRPEARRRKRRRR